MLATLRIYSGVDFAIDWEIGVCGKPFFFVTWSNTTINVFGNPKRFICIIFKEEISDFLAQKHKESLTKYVQTQKFAEQVKYIGVLHLMSHRRMTMTFRGSEIILLWSKQAQRCLHLVVNRSKNCLFRVFSTPMYVCQLWNECAQSSILNASALPM